MEELNECMSNMDTLRASGLRKFGKEVLKRKITSLFPGLQRQNHGSLFLVFLMNVQSWSLRKSHEIFTSMYLKSA